MLSSVEKETYRKSQEDMWGYDVRHLLSDVPCPTLVMHRENILFSAETCAGLAASIPGARALMLTGPGGLPWMGDIEPVASAVEDFLLPGGASRQTDDRAPSAAMTAVILFADIVDSTALSEQLGDTTFRERSRVLEERVRQRIVAHGGTAVAGRTMGDGVLATFASASDAIAASLDCASAGEEVGLALHLGLHAGDVMRERAPDGRDNVYGQAVSIASRVSDLSAPNEVLVSATVRDIARASAGVAFEDRGERELKGVSEPVRVFAVRAALRSE
jgi:class 3 adenylate cyclase